MTARPLLVLICAPALFASYAYFVDSPLTSGPPYFLGNGSLSFTTVGMTSSDPAGGSLLYWAAPSSNELHIDTRIHLTASGGNYIHYHRASSDARTQPNASGTFYSVELMAPGLSPGRCTAELGIYKRQNGVLTLLALTYVPCRDGMVMRSVLLENPRRLDVYIDGVFYAGTIDSSLGPGMTGIGVSGAPYPNSISWLGLGVREHDSPAAVDASTLAVSAFSNSIDVSWRPADDGPNGVGIKNYDIYRDGMYKYSRAPQFTDAAVQPNTTYTYTIVSWDYHWNQSATTQFTVTTPAAGSIDPRQVGVRPLGAYWGALGEQIDMRSGNLNFALPLIKAAGRNGNSLPINLTYNSQVWRNDASRVWKLGVDTGYGFGWRLLAGSITPYWSDFATVHHYTYTDASGAEYRLDIKYENPVTHEQRWTSKEGVYVTFDVATQRLYFRDGTYFVMGCTSGGTEEDGGTLYPTMLVDPNGNQIILRYEGASGVLWTNSSSRIAEIEDVRGYGTRTHWFEYTGTAPARHLNRIQNRVGTAEKYLFTFASKTLRDPFNNTSYGTVSELASVTIDGLGIGHAMSYGNDPQAPDAPENYGELTSVTYPYLGRIRWAYTTGTLDTNRQVREVRYRYLKESPVAVEGPAYTFDCDWTGDVAWPSHPWRALTDPSGAGQKVWSFNTSRGQWYSGVLASYEERPVPGNTTKLRLLQYSWATDAAGTPYISQVNTTLDPGSGYGMSAKTTQTLDIHGNVINSAVWDYWAELTTEPAASRIYRYTYLSDANHDQYLIYDRLTGAYVTPAGEAEVMLASNSYDYFNWPWPWQNWTPIPEDAQSITEYDATLTAAYPGNLTTQSVPGRTIHYRRNRAGSVAWMVDPVGHSQAVSTSAATNYAAPSAISPSYYTTPNAQLGTSATYTSFLGIASVTEPGGGTSSFSYDTYARPLSSMSKTGAVTTYTYTNATSTALAYRTATISTNNRWEKTYYDGFGRTVRVERGPQNGAALSSVKTEYAPCNCSPLGRTRRVSQPYAGADATLWTVYAYDASGRTTSVTAADGSISTYRYRGNRTQVTDAAGKWKVYTTDAFGRLVTVMEPDPLAPGTVADPLLVNRATETNVSWTDYSYDVLDHLTSVTMARRMVPNGPVVAQPPRRFTYDMATGRLLFASYPEAPVNGGASPSVSYTYNTDGTLASKTDAKGQKTTYVYDVYQRVTETHRFLQNGAEDACQAVTYGYDSVPQDAGGGYYWGKLTQTQYHGFTCAARQQFNEYYAYSLAGFPVSKRLRVRGAPDDLSIYTDYVASYGYNPDGQITSITYPSYKLSPNPEVIPGEVVTYGVDSMGRLNTVSGGAATQVTGAVYGPADELKTLTFGPSSPWTETRTYNDRLQLTGISAPGRINEQYVYPSANNNNGQISQLIRPGVETITYQYDSLKRLTSAVANTWSQAYGYDGFGNLYQIGTTSHGVDANTNRLVGPDYDPNGNITSINGLSLTYDVENRITQVTGPGLNMQYVYDPNNRRILGDNGLVFYGVRGEKLMEVGTAIKTFVYFESRLVRVSGAMGANPANITPDRLGSQGGPYYPYGKEYTPTAENADKFATYHRDLSGLDYADQRYYSSTIGRFLTADAAEGFDPSEPQSWNRYSYVGGDPINRIDPTGEYWISLGFFQVPGGQWSIMAWIEPTLSWMMVPWAFFTPAPPSPAPTPTPTQPRVTSKSQAGDGTRAAIDRLSGNCVTQINQKLKMTGDVRASLKNKSTMEAFWDARSPGGEGSIWADTIARGAAHYQLYSGGYSTTMAYVIDAGGHRTGNVVLKANFFSATRPEQEIVLVHELLHIYSDKDDPALAQALGIYDGTNQSSQRISAWLRGNCDRLVF